MQKHVGVYVCELWNSFNFSVFFPNFFIITFFGGMKQSTDQDSIKFQSRKISKQVSDKMMRVSIA